MLIIVKVYSELRVEQVHSYIYVEVLVATPQIRGQ